MSFNISTGSTPVTAEEITNALKNAYSVLPDGVHTPEHDALAYAAADAANDLAAACGPGPFSVSVTGHANAGHAKVPGWSDTHLSVQISAVLPAVEETK